MTVPNLGRFIATNLARRGNTPVVKKTALEALSKGKIEGKDHGSLAAAVVAIKESSTVKETDMVAFEMALSGSLESRNVIKRAQANEILYALKSYNKLSAQSGITSIESSAVAQPATRRSDRRAATVQLDPSHNAPPETRLTDAELMMFEGQLESRKKLVFEVDAQGQETGTAYHSDEAWGTFDKAKYSQFSDLKYAQHSIVGAQDGPGHRITANDIQVQGRKVGTASQYPNDPQALIEFILQNNVSGLHNLASDQDINTKGQHNFYFKIEVDTNRRGAANKSSQGYVILPDRTLLVSQDGIVLRDGSRAKIHSTHKRTERDSTSVLTSEVYELSIEHGGTTKIIPVLHTPNWADHGGVHAQALTDLVALRERTFGRENLANVNTHCRAGVGRTGTILLAEEMIHNHTPLEVALRDIRASRSALMVQSKPQSLSLLALARLHGLPLTEAAEAAAPSTSAPAIPTKWRAIFAGKQHIWDAIYHDEATLRAYVDYHSEIEVADLVIADLEARSEADRRALRQARASRTPLPAEDSDTDSDDLDSDDDLSSDQPSRRPPPPPPPSSGAAGTSTSFPARPPVPPRGARPPVPPRGRSDTPSDDSGAGAVPSRRPSYSFKTKPSFGSKPAEEPLYATAQELSYTAEDYAGTGSDIYGTPATRVNAPIYSPTDEEDIFMPLKDIRKAMRKTPVTGRPAAPLPTDAGEGTSGVSTRSSAPPPLPPRTHMQPKRGKESDSSSDSESSGKKGKKKGLFRRK